MWLVGKSSNIINQFWDLKKTFNKSRGVVAAAQRQSSLIHSNKSPHKFAVEIIKTFPVFSYGVDSYSCCKIKQSINLKE